MNKKAEVVRVYLPPDANCLLSVMDHCLRSRHYVNVVIAGKHPAPQWLTMDAAVEHCTAGIGIWEWASNDQAAAPDVVMACCGDVPTLETLAAVSILREHLPDLKIRVVNVVDLMKLQPQIEHPHGLSDMDFDELFTKDKPVIFAFHGYPWLIHRLTYRRTNHDNLHVRGYKEEGTITTPFDMTVLNDLDRFHLVLDVIDRLPLRVLPLQRRGQLEDLSRGSRGDLTGWRRQRVEPARPPGPDPPVQAGPRHPDRLPERPGMLAAGQLADQPAPLAGRQGRVGCLADQRITEQGHRAGPPHAGVVIICRAHHASRGSRGS